MEEAPPRDDQPEWLRENSKSNETSQAYVFWSHSDKRLLWAAVTVSSMWVTSPKLSCFFLEGYIAMWRLKPLDRTRVEVLSGCVFVSLSSAIKVAHVSPCFSAEPF